MQIQALILTWVFSNPAQVPRQPTMSETHPHQLTANRQPKFAFFHDEASGYLHMKHLGRGVQGSAALVRCVQTGNLIVREKTAFEPIAHNPYADQFYLPHPHIVQLLGAVNYSHERTYASATFWLYANDQRLCEMYERYRAAGQLVPEILIWQCLSHLLSAYSALHATKRTHSDGHAGNIFIHWDGTSVLPDFILGDLGSCEAFDDQFSTGDGKGEVLNGTFRQVNDNHNAKLDNIIGLPTLQQLYQISEINSQGRDAGTDLAIYSYPCALDAIASDMNKLTECIGAMMYDPDFGAASAGLESMYRMLDNLSVFAISVHVRTMDRWNHLFTQLRTLVARELEFAISRTSFPVRGLESFGPRNIEHRPELFDSVEQLLAADERPPGPWNIATVDPESLEILNVDRSTTYCLYKAYPTDANDGIIAGE